MREFNFLPDGKVPFIWTIDESNDFVTVPHVANAPVITPGAERATGSPMTFVDYIIREINPAAKVSLAFVIAPGAFNPVPCPAPSPPLVERWQHGPDDIGPPRCCRWPPRPHVAGGNTMPG